LNAALALLFYVPVWLLLLLCAGAEHTYWWLRSGGAQQLAEGITSVTLPVRVSTPEQWHKAKEKRAVQRSLW
jgi:hypothetical protein